MRKQSGDNLNEKEGGVVGIVAAALARVLSVVAGFHESRGAYTRAEARYRRAVGLMGRAGRRPADLLVRVLRRLASMLQERADHDGAEALLHEALAVAKEAFGPNDLRVGAVLNDLRIVAKGRRRYSRGGGPN